MNAVVKTILPGSAASGTIIAQGDVLRKINGNEIADVLDYRFFSYDARLMIELSGADGKLKLVRLSKPEGADIGLEFETYLMDAQLACSNKCVFCFIDQLTGGMRKSLYYKDDDVRLSFLQGNYVTLTNLSQREIERIVKQRISPVNVSVHTLDPALRSFMLGTDKAAAGIDALRVLAGGGITLNCQIVCCPGINDGENLSKTLSGFIALGSAINSVSIVPVGLTKHREGLTPLRTFSREMALKTVRQVGFFGEKCKELRRSRLFFCADEMYIKAGLKLPSHAFYEDYPQLENGVGMMRLFITEFEDALRQITRYNSRIYVKHPAFSVATGAAAEKYLTKLLKMFTVCCDNIVSKVYAIRNDFFGDSVTVSGLVTGGDMMEQLKDRELGERLLIPQNMLRRGEEVFLDGATVTEVSAALGVPVRIVKQDGADFLCAIIE